MISDGSEMLGVDWWWLQWCGGDVAIAHADPSMFTMTYARTTGATDSDTRNVLAKWVVSNAEVIWSKNKVK